jgi:hypothetical protein
MNKTCLIILLFISVLFSSDKFPKVDTTYLSNHSFVVRTIKIDTTIDTMEIIITKVKHPIDWDLMMEDIDQTLNDRKVKVNK